MGAACQHLHIQRQRGGLKGEVLTVGDLKAEQTNEEESRDIGELVTNKAQVLIDAHDGSVVQNDLVEELHGVAQKHERHHAQVNLAPQPLHVDGTIGRSGIAVLIEKLPCLVDVALAGAIRLCRGLRISEDGCRVLLFIDGGRHGEGEERRVRFEGVCRRC